VRRKPGTAQADARAPACDGKDLACVVPSLLRRAEGAEPVFVYDSVQVERIPGRVAR
jgi:hypothetical protein